MDCLSLLQRKILQLHFQDVLHAPSGSHRPLLHKPPFSYKQFQVPQGRIVQPASFSRERREQDG